MLRIVPPSVEVRQQPPGAFDPKYSDLLKPGGLEFREKVIRAMKIRRREVVGVRVVSMLAISKIAVADLHVTRV